MTNYAKTTLSGSNATIAVPTGWLYQIFGTGDKVTLADGAAALISGDSAAATAGANDQLTIFGAAETVYVNGPGDSVTIGGNGQYAADANLDTVFFAAAGLLFEQDSSRVAVYGDHVTAAIGANDLLGAFGSGLDVTVNGANDGVWIGRNGQMASDANLDNVRFAQGGSLYLQDWSRVSSYGDNVAIYVGSNDYLGAFGSGLNVSVNGANDGVWIGRNGQMASDANLDNVWFAQGGSLYLQDWSRVSSYGDNVAISVGAYDYLGAFGSGLNVSVAGANDGVWIGRNGQMASDANLDNVWFAQGGSLYLQDWSRVSSYGDNVAISVGNHDFLGAFGSGIDVVVNGVGSSVWIGRNGETAAAGLVDTVATSQATSVYLQDYSTVDVSGAGNTVYVGAHDTASAVGAGVNVIVNGVFSDVFVGNGETSVSTNAAPATVSLGAQYGTLTVAAFANVVVQGAPNWSIVAGARSTLTLNGNQDSVQVGVGATANLNGAYDTVSTAGGLTHIALSGHSDSIYVDQNPGSIYVAGFDATDTLLFSTQYVSGFAQAMSFARQDGTSVVIDDQAGHFVSLANTNLSSLGLAQFQFV